MSVKIRLKQIGKRDQRGYRIVAVDESAKRDGKVIEVIGHITPGSKPPAVTLKKDRYDYWMSVGAQLTDGTRKILSNG